MDGRVHSVLKRLILIHIDVYLSRETPFDTQLIERYKKAIDTAVKIATTYNVQPIKGRTIVLCDIGTQMFTNCSAARGLGKPRQVNISTVEYHLFGNFTFFGTCLIQIQN